MLFIYAGRVYEQLLEGHKKYGTARMELPIPKFYVFYKGKEVISMLTAEWNMEEALEVAREEGEISGQRKNEEKMVINLYKAGGKLELIATAAEKSVEEIKQILNRSGVIPE